MAAAAILASLDQVQILANSGECDLTIKDGLLNSVLVFDAPSPDAVFADQGALRRGYRQLSATLGDGLNQDNKVLVGYWIGVNRIARYLMKNQALQSTLKTRLEQIKLTPDATDLDAALGKIYEDTIGTLPYRLNVYGKASHLSRAETKNSVRSLLLVAVRATVLWRQLGGGFLQLMFNRGKYLSAAKVAATGA